MFYGCLQRDHWTISLICYELLLFTAIYPILRRSTRPTQYLHLNVQEGITRWIVYACKFMFYAFWSAIISELIAWIKPTCFWKNWTRQWAFGQQFFLKSLNYRTWDNFFWKRNLGKIRTTVSEWHYKYLVVIEISILVLWFELDKDIWGNIGKWCVGPHTSYRHTVFEFWHFIGLANNTFFNLFSNHFPSVFV